MPLSYALRGYLQIAHACRLMAEHDFEIHIFVVDCQDTVEVKKKKKKNKKKTSHGAVDGSETATVVPDLPNHTNAVEAIVADDDEEEIEAAGDGKLLSHLLQVTVFSATETFFCQILKFFLIKSILYNEACV